MLFNIFMRQSLIDDFWGLHKNMNWATFFKNESYALVLINPIQDGAGGQIIKLEPRPPLKNCGFSGQILIKLRL